MRVRALYILELVMIFLLRLPAFLFIHALFTFVVCGILGHIEYIGMSWLLLVPCISCFLLKELTRSNYVGILAGLGLVAVMSMYIMVASQSPLVRLCWIVATILIVLHGLGTRKDMFERNSFIVSTVFSMLMYALVYFLDLNTLRNLFAGYVFLLLLDQILCGQLRGLLALVQSRFNQQSSKRSLSALLRHNIGVMGSATIALVAVIILAVFLPSYPNLAENIHFEKANDPPPQILVEQEQASLLRMSDEGEYVESQVPIPVYESQGDDITFIPFLTMLLIIPFALLIILITRKGLKDKKKRDEGLLDYDEFIELEEDVLDLRRRGRRGSLLRDVNQTIRQLFRRKVRAHRVKGTLQLQGYHTADQIVGFISPQENIEDLGDLYQDARYSGRTMTKEELKAYYDRRKG